MLNSCFCPFTSIYFDLWVWVGLYKIGIIKHKCGYKHTFWQLILTKGSNLSVFLLLQVFSLGVFSACFAATVVYHRRFEEKYSICRCSWCDFFKFSNLSVSFHFHSADGSTMYVHRINIKNRLSIVVIGRFRRKNHQQKCFWKFCFACDHSKFYFSKLSCSASYNFVF